MTTGLQPMWMEIDERSSDEHVIRWEIDMTSGEHRVTIDGDLYVLTTNATEARDAYEHPFVGWAS